MPSSPSSTHHNARLATKDHLYFTQLQEILICLVAYGKVICVLLHYNACFTGVCSIVPIFGDLEIFLEIVLDSFTSFFLQYIPYQVDSTLRFVIVLVFVWAKHTGVGKYQDSKNRFLKIDLYKYIPMPLATFINYWFYLAALLRSILSHPTSSFLL